MFDTNRYTANGIDTKGERRSMNFEPELLKFADGTAVTSNRWEERRSEIIDILSREEYGYSPKPPETVSGTVTECEKKCCSGHAVLETIKISFKAQLGEYSFPIRFFAPKKEHCPLIVMLNFSDEPYHRYIPAEEIIENGFALAVIYYNAVTTDDGDFTNGIAAMYQRNETVTWGKISMWAFAASRAIDYLVTRKEVDPDCITVAGHSRLGKTALWCGAQDERVRFTYSNDSGCCGAAYERIKHNGAETLESIIRVYPFWFCDNFSKYAKSPDERPFDQHFLLAAIAPRYLLVGSASLDVWADQYSEQLSCIAASPAWSLNGLNGFCGDNTPFSVDQTSLEGSVGYHLRDGVHFFGRTDWLRLMKFIKNHKA